MSTVGDSFSSTGRNMGQSPVKGGASHPALMGKSVMARLQGIFTSIGKLFSGNQRVVPAPPLAGRVNATPPEDLWKKISRAFCSWKSGTRIKNEGTHRSNSITRHIKKQEERVKACIREIETCLQQLPTVGKGEIEGNKQRFQDNKAALLSRDTAVKTPLGSELKALKGIVEKAKDSHAESVQEDLNAILTGAVGIVSEGKSKLAKLSKIFDGLMDQYIEKGAAKITTIDITEAAALQEQLDSDETEVNEALSRLKPTDSKNLLENSGHLSSISHQAQFLVDNGRDVTGYKEKVKEWKACYKKDQAQQRQLQQKQRQAHTAQQKKIQQATKKMLGRVAAIAGGEGSESDKIQRFDALLTEINADNSGLLNKETIKGNIESHVARAVNRVAKEVAKKYGGALPKDNVLRKNLSDRGFVNPSDQKKFIEKIKLAIEEKAVKKAAEQKQLKEQQQEQLKKQLKAAIQTLNKDSIPSLTNSLVDFDTTWNEQAHLLDASDKDSLEKKLIQGQEMAWGRTAYDHSDDQDLVAVQNKIIQKFDLRLSRKCNKVNDTKRSRLERS